MRARTFSNREVAALLGITGGRVCWLAYRLGARGRQGHHRAYSTSEVVALYVADGLIRMNGTDSNKATDLAPAFYCAHFPRASECPEMVAWVCGTDVVIHGNARTIVEKSAKARRLGYVVKVVNVAPILAKLREAS